MKKRILLIGYNFHPEPTGIGKYSGEMIHWLAKKGYDCTVITAYPYYPFWRVQPPYFNKRFAYSTETEKFASGGKITVCRCPMYVPANPSGIKRILLDFSFLVSAFFRLVCLLPKQNFEVVFVVSPSFLFGLLGVLYRKIKKLTFIYHIQDLQIEAAKDLQMIKSNKIIDYLFVLERYVLRHADVITSISPAMIELVQQKVNKPVQLFLNWTDTDLIFPISAKAKLKEEFGFDATKKILSYSGAIGEKQGLEAIIWVAEEYRDCQDIQFVICGSGPYKEMLKKIAEESGLNNIAFLPLQPVEKFNDFLNSADIHLVIQKANVSNLVMPSKITNILAVGGLAVLTANEGSSLYSLIKEHDMGILVQAENQVALNEGIRKALAVVNAADTKISENASAYAKKHLAIDEIMQKLEKLLK